MTKTNLLIALVLAVVVISVSYFLYTSRHKDIKHRISGHNGPDVALGGTPTYDGKPVMKPAD